MKTENPFYVAACVARYDLDCDGWVFVRHDGDLFVFRPV